MHSVTGIKCLRLITALMLVAVSFLPGLVPAKSANAAYNAEFTNFWIGKVSPGTGHIGVDLWWPNGASEYNPCHHSNDAFYGACILSNQAQSSYYKVMAYTPSGSDFPYGVFLDNQNPNYCTSSSWCTNKTATSFNHGWTRLISDGSLEIYPHDGSGQYRPSTNNVGGVRIRASFFHFANGGRYSPNIGDVSLPQVGQSGVGRLNGFITHNGVTINSNDRVLFEIFQRDSTRKTSTGYPMEGFTVVRNNGDGYFNTGAVPSGSYKIYITDTQTNRKIILDGLNIFQAHERMDLRLEQRCFGYTGPNCIDPA